MTGVVFWGAVVGSVGAEVLGRAIAGRRRGAKGGGAGEESDEATTTAASSASSSAADGDEEGPAGAAAQSLASSFAGAAAAPPQVREADHGHPEGTDSGDPPAKNPREQKRRRRFLRRAAYCALAAAAAFAAVAARRGPLPPLPGWVPRDWREAADLVLLPLPAFLGGGGGNAAARRRRRRRVPPPPPALSPGVPPGAPAAPLAAGTLPGHAPLVEVVRFKERQWYLEELDDSRGGDANAMVRLARMRLHGQGCPPSVSAAGEWVSRARALGAAATLDELVATDSPDPRAAVVRRAREEEDRRRALGERIGRAMGRGVGGGGGGGGGGGAGGGGGGEEDEDAEDEDE